ncbi:MAG TPA: hypothetical protein VMP11_05105 [Verrucomicrobiae bacterium]|nr:hypothetical protein [Verrucomicrobiae bacterium]
MHRPRSISTLALIALAILFPTVVRADNGDGVISGTVRLLGPAPHISTIQPEPDFDACGTAPRPTQQLIVSTNGGVRDAVIYLGTLTETTSPVESNAPIVLDQRNCEFVPRIQIARSGVPFILKNSDPVLDVVRIDSMSGTNGQRLLLEEATPYAGFEKTYQFANFREPILLHVSSANGHEWMAAYIAVMPHPCAALTDENGRFVIHHVPAGTHKIYAWHEVLGVLTKEVRINGSRSATVDFEFTTGK